MYFHLKILTAHSKHFSSTSIVAVNYLQAESIVFTVVQAPRHGTVERTSNGQHYRQTSSFTMDDVYQNRISYNHDGSNSLKDRFTFGVADGTNLLFMVEEGGKEVGACVCVCRPMCVCVCVCVCPLTYLAHQERYICRLGSGVCVKEAAS